MFGRRLFASPRQHASHASHASSSTHPEHSRIAREEWSEEKSGKRKKKVSKKKQTKELQCWTYGCAQDAFVRRKYRFFFFLSTQKKSKRKQQRAFTFPCFLFFTAACSFLSPWLALIVLFLRNQRRMGERHDAGTDVEAVCSCSSSVFLSFVLSFLLSFFL